ncbi:MAG: SCO family protein [Bdellovibrionales bacterium]|nr:SCO family protein [Bdellovibrionales bacterium]
MKTHTRFVAVVFLGLSVVFSAFGSGADKAAGLAAQNEKGPDMSGVGITDKLGGSIDLGLKFTDETGKSVRLGDFFAAKRPVIISMAYYQCPMLCGVILNALVDGMKELAWTPGKEFALVNVSIDPREKPELAATKKKNLVEALGKPEAAAGWHFLTGEENQIKALAGELGFGYRWDEKEKQFAHGAGIFVLTPDGKISRVLYGIQYRASDLRLSLLEASNGKIGTIIDRILLFCFSYNTHLRQYSLTVTRVLQVAFVAVVLVLGGFIAISRRREMKS